MRLLLRYLSIQLRSEMQHKANFFFSILGQALTSFVTIVGVGFMFTHVNAVEGFSFNEVLLCCGTVLMAYSMGEAFGRGFDSFAMMLGDGRFDRALVRPRNEIFQVLASNVTFTRLGRFLEAIVIFIYVIPRAGVVWTVDRALVLALMVLCGAVLFMALFWVNAGLCFFTTEGLEFINIFTDGGREFGRYPMNIYGEGVLKLVTYIVPLALIQYYPLTYILGRAEHWWYALLPLAALLFMLPCYGLWRLGMRHYRSTGS